MIIFSFDDYYPIYIVFTTATPALVSATLNAMLLVGHSRVGYFKILIDISFIS